MKRLRYFLVTALILASPATIFALAVLTNHDHHYQQLAETGGILCAWLGISMFMAGIWED